MKIKIDKSNLQLVLNRCANIVDRKATMPILANILITAKKNSLVISATDLEVTAVVSSKAEITETGTITVNAKILTDIVRELPDGEVSIELGSGDRITIKAGGAKLKLHGVSADEYPNLPGVGLSTVKSMSTTTLLEMINKTIFAVSDDETSFNLTGVYFSNQEDNLRLVATDGHRIAIIDRPVNALKIKEGVIVPKKGLSEIRRYLQDLDAAEVGVTIDDGFLVVSSSDVKFSVRLIDADFPDYTQVIPKSKKSRAKINAENLSHALKRVSLMVTDRIKGVKLKFADDTLVISGSSSEVGEATEKIAIEYTGEETEIGFNANYLQDIINSLSDTEEIIVDLSGGLGPGRFFAEADPEYFSIVMPMRIG